MIFHIFHIFLVFFNHPSVEHPTVSQPTVSTVDGPRRPQSCLPEVGADEQPADARTGQQNGSRGHRQTEPAPKARAGTATYSLSQHSRGWRLDHRRPSYHFKAPTVKHQGGRRNQNSRRAQHCPEMPDVQRPAHVQVQVAHGDPFSFFSDRQLQGVQGPEPGAQGRHSRGAEWMLGMHLFHLK